MIFSKGPVDINGKGIVAVHKKPLPPYSKREGAIPIIERKLGKLFGNAANRVKEGSVPYAFPIQ
jgi:hypothetical protein